MSSPTPSTRSRHGTGERVKKILEIFLGILTAFGGFVDIGDLVANGETGARFGMRLAWAVVVGVIGIVVYAEMAGRVATMSKHPVFDVVRERLGARWALVNLGASFSIQLLTGLNYLLWVPLVAIAVWIVLWKVRFSLMEKVFGLSGLTLIVTAFALWRLDPGLHRTVHAAGFGPPAGEGWAVYAFFAIALLGAAMTPYEVFFFSSGAVEEHWTRKDLLVNRLNVYIGFPLGGILSLAIMGASAVVFEPQDVSLSHLSQVTLPVSMATGKLGLVLLLYGMFAAIFSAALETALSAGYTASQYFGWQWGTFVRPREAARFHFVVLASIVVGVLITLSTIDPILITEYSIVLAAAALPLTYLPILLVANDPTYMQDKVNSRFLNAIAFLFLVVLLVVSVATIPLMIYTKGGA
jgi:Mn2+/Fe2+ NRAMP family transporter